MGRRPSELQDRWEVLEFPSHSETLVATDAAKDRTHKLGEKQFVVGGDLAQQLQRQTVAAVQQFAGWTRPRVRHVYFKMVVSLALLRHGSVQEPSPVAANCHQHLPAGEGRYKPVAQYSPRTAQLIGRSAVFGACVWTATCSVL